MKDEKMGDMKQCYNKGCSKQFSPKDNHDKACNFHPGEPYFHDAYKEWTCCKKRSVDFTEFLNYKGCTSSFHNDQKPPEKDRAKPVEIEEQSTVTKPREPMPRPDVNGPMRLLQPEVTSSLRNALADQLGQLTVKGTGDEDARKQAVKIGDPCQNRGCSTTYSGVGDDLCLHHPGFPVFHEGMKYWTCCQRKTSDFDVFLKQAGCEQGTHLWKKPEAELKLVPTCRTDWHQTGSHAYATFYAKNCLPEKSFVQVNPVKMRVRLVFDAGQSVFEKEIVLGGIIDVENSQVTMAAPKVEVKMKKAELVAWKGLELPGSSKPVPSECKEDSAKKQ